MYVGNVGSSVSQAGWMPSRAARTRAGVWAATDMETFSVWSDEARKAPSLQTAFFLRVFISPLARPEQRFGYPRALCSHADAHLGHGLFRRMSRVRRERAERYRRLKRACVFSFAPTIRLPFSRAPLKGRHRAAQERGLPRPRLALVFRAVVDGPSQGRRAISAPGRTGKLQPNPCLRSNVCRRSERSRPTSF